MLTSKQRAKLKSIAMTEDTILQVGKNGIIDTLTVQVSDALKARELIKMKVQDACMLQTSLRKKPNPKWFRSSGTNSCCSSAILRIPKLT
jgi:RNA-binding protein YhbY